MTVAKIILLIEILISVNIWLGLDYVVLYALYALKLTKGALSTGAIFFIVTSVSLVFVLLLTYFSQKLRKRSFLEYGLYKNQLPSWIFVGQLILWALGIQYICVYLIEKPADYFFHLKVDFPPITSVESFVFFLLTGIFGGGLREELFFRGYLMTKLQELLPQKNWSVVIASFLQIIFFTYLHLYQGIVGLVENLFLAVLFTLIYLRTKSLWCAIFFHIFIDIWGITGIYLKQ